MTQPPRTPFADVARGATPTAPPRVAHEQLKPYVEEGTPDIKVSKWTHEIVPEVVRVSSQMESKPHANLFDGETNTYWESNGRATLPRRVSAADQL